MVMITVKASLTALALTVSLLTATAARSADLDVDPAYDWSGFYAGLQAGHGWSGAEWTNTISGSAFTDYAVGSSDDHDMMGFFAGAHVGYNWQSQGIVFGGELAFLGTGINGSSISTQGVADDDITTSIDYMTMATVRLGFAADDFLPYIKGGYAGGLVNMDVNDSVGGNQGTWDDDEWHHGFVVGAGIEYGMTPTLTLGLEYNFVRLADQNHSATGSTGIVDAFDVDVDDVHLVAARLNVKF